MPVWRLSSSLETQGRCGLSAVGGKLSPTLRRVDDTTHLEQHIQPACRPLSPQRADDVLPGGGGPAVGHHQQRGRRRHAGLPAWQPPARRQTRFETRQGRILRACLGQPLSGRQSPWFSSTVWSMLALVAAAGPGTAPVPAVHGCSLLADAGIHLDVGAGGTSPVGPLFDSGTVAVRETGGPGSALVVSPPVAGSILRHVTGAAASLLDTELPLGRQHLLWKTIPVLSDQLGLPSPRASPCPVKVAAVMLLVDPNGSILLTRRAASMRSYPGCWVLPGGAVDPGETLADAAAREVAEETSLVVSPGALRPLACWESAFPLSPAGFAAARGLKAHVLMAAFVAAVPEAAPAVTCNPEEVDSACWVAASDIAPLLDGSLAASHTDCCSTSAGGGIGAAQLVGVYPNDLTPPEGLGLAHHFVLHTWLAAGRPCAPAPA